MSTYHGWQNSLRKRFSHNLSFDVNYTWSKSISNAGGDTGAYYDGENGVRNQNFFDLRADRGPSISDITHYFSGAWVYQLPALTGQHAIVRHTLGGWQATGMVRAQTGLPITITQSSSTPMQRADYAGGERRIIQLPRNTAISEPSRVSKDPCIQRLRRAHRPGKRARYSSRAGNVEC